MKTTTKLSYSWLIIMLNILFADILSIILELTIGNTINLIGSDPKTTMAIAAVVTSIPILMIYFSLYLKPSINYKLNMLAALLTLIYVIGGSSSSPHYIILVSIEVIFLIHILWISWKWRQKIISKETT